MAIIGLGIAAVCGGVPGAISRYYWIRPELTQAGIKNLTKGSLIGLAMQTTALVTGIIGATSKTKNNEQIKRFDIAYTIMMVASIPVSAALAGKFNFKLSYQEAATTAALYWAIHMAGKFS